MGEGHCFWNQTMRGFSGSRIAFQVFSLQEVAAFLALVWWIQGMILVTLIAVGVARTTIWGSVQTGQRGSFFQSFTHTISPGWQGCTQFPNRIGDLSKFSLVMCLNILPRLRKWLDISKSPICQGSPFSLFITGGGLPYWILIRE